MGNHEHSGFISEGLHELLEGMGAVSYTHLDVYKRQNVGRFK